MITAYDLVTNPAGFKTNDQLIIKGFAVHHTVSQNKVLTEAEERNAIKAIDAQHVSQGFGGFGYHGITFASGRSYRCGEGQRAHVEDRNHELRGWALHGTFTDVMPGEAQMNGLREALIEERSRFGPQPIKGHDEWALPGNGTLCPGVVSPRDWDAFLQNAPVVVGGDWVYSHNQLLAMQNGQPVVAIGDWEGKFPGQIAKLFGTKWYWLRMGQEYPEGAAGDRAAYWSPVQGD